MSSTSRLARVGAWCFDRRRRVLAGWVAALAFAIVVLQPLAGTFEADFRTPGSDSTAADQILQDRFPGRSASTIDVVWRAGAGARSPQVRKRIDALLAQAGELKGIGEATPAEISRDGATAVARLQIDAERDSDVPKATGERLVGLAKGASGDGLRVAMSGWAINEAEGGEVSSSPTATTRAPSPTGWRRRPASSPPRPRS